MPRRGLAVSTFVRLTTQISAGGVLRTAYGTGLLVTTEDGIPAGGAGKIKGYADIEAVEVDFASGEALAAARVWFGCRRRAAFALHRAVGDRGRGHHADGSGAGCGWRGAAQCSGRLVQSRRERFHRRRPSVRHDLRRHRHGGADRDSGRHHGCNLRLRRDPERRRRRVPADARRRRRDQPGRVRSPQRRHRNRHQRSARHGRRLQPRLRAGPRHRDAQ